MSEKKDKLLSDISKLAKDNSADSDNFLKSLTELAESEEYGDVTRELLKETSEEESVSVSPFFVKSVGARKAAEKDDLRALFLEVQDNAAEVAVDKSEYEMFDDDLPEIDYTPEPEPESELKPEKPVSEPTEEKLHSEKTPEVKSEDIKDFTVDVGDVFDIPDAEAGKNEPDEVPVEPKVNIEKISELVAFEPESETEAEAATEKTPDPDDLIAALKRKPESKKPDEKKPDEKKPDDNPPGNDEPPKTEEIPKKNKKKKKKKGPVYTILMLACIGVFLYCVIRIGIYYYTGWQYKKSNAKLQEIVGDISKDVEDIKPKTITVTDTDIFFPDELVYVKEDQEPQKIEDEVSDKWKKQYESLYEMNHDCVGWIQIPDTQINYPVMYTPGDYEKYLYKNFEGKYLFRGLPFMAENTLLNKSQNYIIYGHNMNDGTAFNNLRKYLNNKWIEDGHKYCYFNTAFAEGVYEVMAVVITKIYTTVSLPRMNLIPMPTM